MYKNYRCWKYWKHQWSLACDRYIFGCFSRHPLPVPHSDFLLHVGLCDNGLENLKCSSADYLHFHILVWKVISLPTCQKRSPNCTVTVLCHIHQSRALPNSALASAPAADRATGNQSQLVHSNPICWKLRITSTLSNTVWKVSLHIPGDSSRQVNSFSTISAHFHPQQLTAGLLVRSWIWCTASRQPLTLNNLHKMCVLNWKCQCSDGLTSGCKVTPLHVDSSSVQTSQVSRLGWCQQLVRYHLSFPTCFVQHSLPLSLFQPSNS